MKYLEEAEVLRQEASYAADVRYLEVHAPRIAAEAVPGQFVNVEVFKGDAPLLRRPLGIATVNRDRGSFGMFYRLIGEATKLLAEAEPGRRLSILGPLGHGFELSATQKPLIVGGGMGLAPLLFLADGLSVPADVLMGGRTEKELFWKPLFADKAREIFVTTDDGSAGTKGNVTALLPQLLNGGYDRVYVCGPAPMMKAVVRLAEEAKIPCQMSLEKYMACGLGACLSCSCGGVGRRLKVCTDGPVFWSGEVEEW